MSGRALKLREQDNVATALEAIRAGDSVMVSCNEQVNHLQVQETIPFGFKICVCDINKGDGIVKYGEVIGQASMNIKSGELVHIHNVEGVRGRGDITAEGI